MTAPLPSSTSDIRISASNTLTWGFRISAALLFVGAALSWLRDETIANTTIGYRDLFSELLHGNSGAVIDLAILTMMATPVVTVLVVALGFFRIGDVRYGRASLIVLGVLAVSIAASFFR